MAILAKAPLSLLETCVAALGDLPTYTFLRSPEIGLAMVRGRVDGTGAPFNLGEMTLTRCVVQMAVPTAPAIAGFGYVAGRSRRHAELAAVCDALLQHPDWQALVCEQVLQPLEAAAQARRETQAAQSEATRVNFFTLLRGEG
jgi:alpha-D-ribose 1-methylphosphonate 5-triphosphate synthase subunit PhnG